MKLIVFQGNPGLMYRKTRHNAGFIVADFLALKNGLKWAKNARVAAETAQMGNLLLVKPQTFYNDTGRAVQSLVQFYKLDPKLDLLVVADDLNLPFGTLRTRLGGSDGGNNGLKSISASLGEQYARLRIGTDNDLRARVDDTDFVLGKFTSEEWGQLPPILESAEKIILDFADGDFQPTKISLLVPPPQV
jgi:PTH1 family peptidyl-tRNA hydrolase